MSEKAKIDLQRAVNGLTLRINNLDVEVDVRGKLKSRVFWKLLTSANSNWKIVEGYHKIYMHIQESTDELVAKALKALSKIRTLSKEETKQIINMPLQEMCKRLILKAFIET
jgi:hypothetical protein